MHNVIAVRMTIAERDSWFTDTSRDLPGFVLADDNREALLDNLPGAIELLYKARYGSACRALRLESAGKPGERGIPWALLPPNTASEDPFLPERD